MRAVSEDLLAATLLPLIRETIGGESGSVARVRVDLKVENKHFALFDALLDMLREAGYLDRRGDVLRLTDAITEEELARRCADHRAATILTVTDDRQVNRFIWPYFDFVRDTVPSIPKLLQGKVTGVQVLFPNNDFAKAKKIYHNSFQCYFYRCLANRVIQHLAEHRQQFPDRPLRVLEVGAGTGMGTIDTLEALQATGEPVEFVFTDLGGGLVRKAKKQFRPHFDWLEFRQLDISRSPGEQGFEAGGYDIVFCSNVIHATPRIRETIANLDYLLAPGGLVLINELCARLPWNTLTVGLTDGWWLPEDEERIPHSPIATIDTLEDCLRGRGFTDLRWHGYPGIEREDLDQVLIEGRKC
jgi:SAM-dependent methyltransferase